MRATLVALSLSLCAASASALPEQGHYDVTSAACVAAGLPGAFCTRAATEAFNTDALEFDDITAHAQSATGQSLCAAADVVAARLQGLGGDLQRALAANDVDGAARALGRGLHTLHDNCAHHGMSNPEHAWYSLSDVCQKTTLSPDLDPAAVPCASAETEVALGAFQDALDAAGVDAATLSTATATRTKKAGYFDKCAFLDEADEWDGRDVGWDRDRVRAPLQAAFAAGLAATELAGPVCAGDPNAIDTTPRPDVDVSDGTPSCFKVHLYCLGKADSLDQEEPTAAAPEMGGCTVAHADGNAGTGLGLLASLLGLALTCARRRRPR